MPSHIPKSLNPDPKFCGNLVSLLKFVEASNRLSKRSQNVEWVQTYLCYGGTYVKRAWTYSEIQHEARILHLYCVFYLHF